VITVGAMTAADAMSAAGAIDAVADRARAGAAW
jgi:hypothetical protein